MRRPCEEVCQGSPGRRGFTWDLQAWSGLDMYTQGERRLDSSIPGWGHSRNKAMEAGECWASPGSLATAWLCDWE